MKRKILLEYAPNCSMITLRQKMVVEWARELSPKWRRFLSSGPVMQAIWYNEIVDWLTTQYPELFRLKSIRKGG